jgi:hypothetical protein
MTEFSDHLGSQENLARRGGRVEGRIEPMAQANTEFVMYLASALIYFGTVILIFIRPLSWRSWLAGLAAGSAWLITWYAPISIWIGAFLELLVLWNSSRSSQKLSLQKPG